MAYKGKWRPKNRNKYEGDPTKIIYRSLWERSTMKWADANPNITSWSSEEVVVPYRSAADGRIHRYYIDFKITYTSGETVLVEVKPDKQTRPPKTPKRKTRRYLNEVKAFAVNWSKWEHAEEFAKDRGWRFEVWTEKDLKRLGIKIYESRPVRRKAK